MELRYVSIFLQTLQPFNQAQFAAMLGHSNILKWARSNGCPWHDDTHFIEDRINSVEDEDENLHMHVHMLFLGHIDPDNDSQMYVSVLFVGYDDDMWFY